MDVSDVPVWDPSGEGTEIDEVVFCEGRRRTGKTLLTTGVLLRMRMLYPVIFVFTRTKRNNWWLQFVPDRNIYSMCPDGKDGEKKKTQKETSAEFEDKLGDVLTKQAARFAKHKLHPTGNPYCLLVFDDCIADSMIRTSTGVNSVLFEGRHMGICAWFLSQDVTGFDRRQRDEFDRFIFFSTKSNKEKDFVRTEFNSVMLERLVALQAEDEFTAVVIDRKPDCKVELLRYREDNDYVKGAMSRNLHFGNRRLWQTTNLAEQKEANPYTTKTLSRATLMSRFNHDSDDELVADDEEISSEEAEL